MEQLEMKLPPKQKSQKKTLLIDCEPRYSHKLTPTNDIGLKIVANLMDADVAKWFEVIPNLSQYDTVGFHVVYIVNILNATSWMFRNGVEPLKAKRKSPRIIFGGQGASNTQGCLDPIGEVFRGEYDGDTWMDGWYRKSEIDTPPFIDGTKTAIELDRGCRWACNMCSYSHVTGGHWRRKDINLAKEQIMECVDQGIKRITFRSANMAGYPDIDELLQFCGHYNVYQGWANISPGDAMRIMPYIGKLKITSPKVGIESFTESVRMDVLRSGKAFSDEYLEEMLVKLLEQGANNVHLYMIYGLPGEDYQNWWNWIYKLADIRNKVSHNVRWDISICNFNPSPGTPLSEAPYVNFTEKAIFIERFIHHMKLSGIYAQHAKMDPQHCYGKLGRREDSYKLTMALRKGGEELTPNIIYALPYGVRRSIAPKYIKRFFNYEEK